jgi:hypothetical protein
MDVPITLRRWFVAHFVVDLAVGIPLLLVPGTFLGALGWTSVDSASTRLVGAALVAIGTQSFLSRHQGVETYRVLLNLKILWSVGAIIALLAAIGDGAPSAVWAFLAAFISFCGVWTHYRIRFKQLEAAPPDRDSYPEPEPPATD